MIILSILNALVAGVMLASAIIVYKAFSRLKPLIDAYKIQSKIRKES